ncbi:MAG: hypothetical protein NT169_12065 [Chloroflexi bacterium]|nr:hypothetical protein [Chloroflexota bacterium]
MQYLFHTAIPVPWLLADILTLLITLVVVGPLIAKSKHPVPMLLEGFGFVFLYAGIFENFAVVNGWYVYGRSLLMFGDVPLAVPLIEMDVLIVGLWLLQKMAVPDWCKPFIVGLFGMLQDFSLDPVAVRQVFTSQGVASGRWSWLFDPRMVNIHNIPVYNFPGWMLIMLYATVYILIGRRWFRHSGYNPLVGWVYPLGAAFLALLTMVSPLSQFLLWLGPFAVKGSSAEWVMLGFHLLFPTLLLLIFWRGRMRYRLSLAADFPILAVVIGFHLADILFALAGGYHEVLGLVLGVSGVHVALLGLIFYLSQRRPLQAGQEEFSVGV